MKEHSRKLTLIWGAIFVATFMFYAKTLSYNFVFDDVWRITKNPAVQNLSSPSLYFTDPSTLSYFPGLNRHNYRPLLTLGFAVENKLWHGGPAAYRLVNLLFHGFNSGLVALCGVVFLGLSPVASLFAGLFYAFHPTQVEAAVWISERSNVLSMTCLLLGLLAWWKFIKSPKIYWAIAVSSAFIVGLFIRENEIIFPVACLFLHRLKVGDQKKIDQPLMTMYAGMGLMAVGYLFLRTLLLKQFAQTSLWGTTAFSQLLAVLENGGRTFQIIVAPFKLSPYHELLPSTSITIIDLVGFGFILGAGIGFLQKKNPRLSFCLSFALLLWLPSSNVIPLAVIFADRFAAPLLIPAGWLLGLLMDRFRKSISVPVAALVISLLLVRTWTYLPVWKNEVSLWERAVQEYPHSNFGWFCLGIAHEDQIDWPQAEQAYQQALKGRMRVEFAAQAFLHLARVTLAEGKTKEAETFAQQAIHMHPDFQATWEAILKNPKSTAGTLEFFPR